MADHPGYYTTGYDPNYPGDSNRVGVSSAPKMAEISDFTSRYMAQFGMAPSPDLLRLLMPAYSAQVNANSQPQSTYSSYNYQGKKKID